MTQTDPAPFFPSFEAGANEIALASAATERGAMRRDTSGSSAESTT